MMKMILIVTLIALASADSCTDCYLQYAKLDYDPSNFDTTRTGLCTGGKTLEDCLTIANCDTYYQNAWGLTCTALQCSGTCPTIDLCGICQQGLDASISLAASLSNLGVSFDTTQFDQLMCTAIDTLGTCAKAAADATKKPCNIEAKNCGLLKSVCPSASCTPQATSLADLYIAADKFKEVFQVQVQNTVAEIKTAIQQSQRTVAGKLRVLWEITLEASADRAAAILAFRTKIAATMGIDLGLITVDITASGNTTRRQTAESWEAVISEPQNSPASTLMLSALAVFAFLVVLF